MFYKSSQEAAGGAPSCRMFTALNKRWVRQKSASREILGQFPGLKTLRVAYGYVHAHYT